MDAFLMILFLFLYVGIVVIFFIPDVKYLISQYKENSYNQYFENLVELNSYNSLDSSLVEVKREGLYKSAFDRPNIYDSRGVLQTVVIFGRKYNSKFVLDPTFRVKNGFGYVTDIYGGTRRVPEIYEF